MLVWIERDLTPWRLKARPGEERRETPKFLDQVRVFMPAGPSQLAHVGDPINGEIHSYQR